MAISFVGGNTGVSVGNTDVSVDLTALTGGSDSSPSNGDLIIFAYNIADADNADLDLACNTVGFTEVADLFGNGTQDANLGVYWKIHDGDTAVVGEGSLGGTDTSVQGVVMVFRGVDQGTPLDVTTTTATGTTGGNPNPPSIDWVTTGAWTVIVGSNAHAANVNGTFTAPTNYTTNFKTVGNQDTADGIIGMGYRTNPADPEDPGAMTSSATATGWCAATLALRPSLSVTVTPGTASLTTTRFTPTVTASDHKTVTPGVASLTTTRFTPTVTASDHKTAIPGTVSLALTAFTPSVNVGVNVVPGVASLNTTLFTPTVTITENVLVTPGTASLSLTRFTPTVTATDHKTVIPGKASLVLTTFIPRILKDADDTTEGGAIVSVRRQHGFSIA